MNLKKGTVFKNLRPLQQQKIGAVTCYPDLGAWSMA